MRHEKPSIVVAWERGVLAPKCCHTCENYDEQGVCQVYIEEPPAEFAATQDQCDQWKMMIPF